MKGFPPMPKEVASVVRKAQRAGWRVGLTRKNHLKFVPPKGTGRVGTVYFSGTTSDRMAVKELITKLRHRGLNLRYES